MPGPVFQTSGVSCERVEGGAGADCRAPAAGAQYAGGARSGQCGWQFPVVVFTGHVSAQRGVRLGPAASGV